MKTWNKKIRSVKIKHNKKNTKYKRHRFNPESTTQVTRYILNDSSHDMSAKCRARSLRGRGHHERLDEAALAVGEGDLGGTDVLEGAARLVADARAPRCTPHHPYFFLTVLAHELTHEWLADLDNRHTDLNKKFWWTNIQITADQPLGRGATMERFSSIGRWVTLLVFVQRTRILHDVSRLIRPTDSSRRTPRLKIEKWLVS